MNKEKKERRCMHCHKLLLNEKMFCRRCILEGRNTSGKIVTCIGGVVTTALSANAIINKDSENNDI